MTPLAGEERPESLIKETKRLLRESSLRARKGLGQHFLVDGRFLGVIITAAELSRSDTVIEVGPGLGVLTRELAGQVGRLVAVELDSQLAGLLRESLAAPGNVAVINDDILKLEPAAILAQGLADTGSGYKVVANLPYYITSPVLRHFLEASLKPRLMVVMVQKEVARAITARPGEMSILAVSVQLYGRPEIISYVPARAFYPAPEVDSAILKISVFSQPASGVDDAASFFRLVRAGFSSARKQIINPLAHGLDLPKPQVLDLLARAGITPERRAETLAVEEWARLWRVFTARGQEIAK